MAELLAFYLICVLCVREWTLSRILLWSLPPLVACAATLIWRLGEVALCDLPIVH